MILHFAIRCECNKGYKPHPRDEKLCIDENECMVNGGGCDHMCTNTEVRWSIRNKSYAFYQIYIYVTHNSNTRNYNLHHLFDKKGAFRCSCRSGYTASPNDPAKCVDINECDAQDKGGCSHDCMVWKSITLSYKVP